MLTEGEKMQLAACERLPDDAEIDDMRMHPDIRDILQAFIGDEGTRSTHLQLAAKRYLARGDVHTAWKVLLLL